MCVDVKLIDRVYDSIFTKKAIVSSDVYSLKRPYLRQLNRKFLLRKPYAKFLPKRELEKSFIEFVLDYLKEAKNLKKSNFHEYFFASTVLSLLHHDNGVRCKGCGQVVDIKYTRLYYNHMDSRNDARCCFFCADDYAVSKCVKCGRYFNASWVAYGPTKVSGILPKMYAVLKLKVSHTKGLETYADFTLSQLRKLGGIYKNGKNITICPTKGVLSSPEIANFVKPKVLSRVLSLWGSDLCLSCRKSICGKSSTDLAAVSALSPFDDDDGNAGKYERVPYQVETVEIYDIEIKGDKVRLLDELIHEIEGNPASILPLLNYDISRLEVSMRGLANTVFRAILNKVARNPNSESVIKEVTVTVKSASILVIVPEDEAKETDQYAIENELDTVLGYINKNIKLKLKCDIDVSLEDGALSVVINIAMD